MNCIVSQGNIIFIVFLDRNHVKSRLPRFPTGLNQENQVSLMELDNPLSLFKLSRLSTVTRVLCNYQL